MATAIGSNRYKAGDRAPQAGIYRVIHTAHRRGHENSFRRNQIFPACKQCGKAVRFELVAADLASKAQSKKH